jgi:CheY-like chemotaxis protein
MLQIMSGQIYRTRIPRYLSGYRIPHKTGDFLPYIGNDVGVLIAPGRTFMISIYRQSILSWSRRMGGSQRAVLICEGRGVEVAAALADVLELLTRFRPDVVVADIGMPGEDGYSLIRQLRDRERPRGDRLPAIALTAYGRAEDRALALESGFDAHLRKPVDTDALLAAIATAVGRLPR